MAINDIEELRSQLRDCQERIEKLENQNRGNFTVGSGRKSKSKSKSKSKKQKTKKKVNAYFQAMIKAKKNGDPSFVYNGKTYVGAKHPHLGMVYKSK